MNNNNAKSSDSVKKTTLYIVAIIFFLGGAGIMILINQVTSRNPQIRKQTIPQTNISKNVEYNIQKQQQAQLEQNTLTNPSDLKAWVNLGNYYFDNKMFQKAIKAYQQYLKINPKNPNVWTDLGIMYRRTVQFESALNAFEQAIKIDSTHQTAHFNRGIVLFYDLRDKKKAILEWEILLKINPIFKTQDGSLLRDFVNEQKKNFQ